MPILISKKTALDTLCHYSDHKCPCLVMHYQFIDDNNQLMRAWFSIQVVVLKEKTMFARTDVIDLSEAATTLAVLPDECSEDIYELLQLHEHDAPTMH